MQPQQPRLPRSNVPHRREATPPMSSRRFPISARLPRGIGQSSTPSTSSPSPTLGRLTSQLYWSALTCSTTCGRRRSSGTGACCGRASFLAC
eukprot:1586271-Pleurochrysis_carterae.AAC.1